MLKTYLFAAAAIVAAPAMAQTAPATTDTTAPAPADTAAPAAAPAATGTMTPGGYQPAGPAISGTPQPGAVVRYQQAPAPDVAFPPPAAKESYPICKKGQFDGCRQKGGR